jgi:hypothetical protein
MPYIAWSTFLIMHNLIKFCKEEGRGKAVQLYDINQFGEAEFGSNIGDKAFVGRDLSHFIKKSEGSLW